MNTHSKILRTAVAAMLLAAVSTTAWATGAGLTRLSGNAPNMQGVKYLGAHSPNAVMNFTLALAPQDRAAMEAAVHAVQDPRSPQYQHFLTHDQVVAQFAPTQAQVDSVKAYLTSQGIKVVSVTPDRMLIHASATTATVEHAFGINIGNYKVDGETVYAPDSDPRMSADMAGKITAVLGLDNVVQLKEHLHAGTPAAATPVSHTIAGGTGPTGDSPTDLANHYSWPVGPNSLPILTDTSLASGVTIGIATAFTYRLADVNTFWKTYGLPTHSVVSVAVDGVTRRLNDETTLDIEHSGAMAPGANIIVYSGVNPGFGTFVDVFDRIFTDNAADVVSTSWGDCEPNNPPAAIGAEEIITTAMLLQGQTIFAAAGDGGAQDRCSGPSGNHGTGFGGVLTISTTDNADYPSSAPGIGAAAGTSLDLAGNTETAWVDGGGADSVLFAEPSYETNTSGWASNSSCFEDTHGDAFAIPAGEACVANGDASRQSSDLAMDADFNLTLFYNGKWLGGFGGTSFVAPELAGLWAIGVNARRTASSLPTTRLGAAPASIFGAVSAGCQEIFTDIGAGSNNGAGGVFNTATGWDHPTGWGVPNGALVVGYLATSGCP